MRERRGVAPHADRQRAPQPLEQLQQPRHRKWLRAHFSQRAAEPLLISNRHRPVVLLPPRVGVHRADRLLVDAEAAVRLGELQVDEAREERVRESVEELRAREEQLPPLAEFLEIAARRLDERVPLLRHAKAHDRHAVRERVVRLVHPKGLEVEHADEVGVRLLEDPVGPPRPRAVGAEEGEQRMPVVDDCVGVEVGAGPVRQVVGVEHLVAFDPAVHMAAYGEGGDVRQDVVQPEVKNRQRPDGLCHVA
mmetsp:Transcript_43787/g.106301  ORF Transcript_43787/g.106301 Transcript_43787/m.106301 type:complete len:250 (-) Transcript_43787:255-1004(-)